MKTKSYVDGFLVDWGAGFFNEQKPRRAKALPLGAGVRAPRNHPKKSGGRIRQGNAGLNAKTVRARLTDLSKRSPQVVVRIYGGGKGMKEIRAHLRYIGRDGEVEIEDEEGMRTASIDDIDQIAGSWKDGALPIPERTTRREAIHVVLSMPAGTDTYALKMAARDFARQEFPNNQYAMALHTVDTPHSADDKDDPPSPNPHIHLLVKKTANNGQRLNPRKEDLRRWREKFAEALRARGIEASATSRAHRLHLPRGDRQAIRQMKDRNRQFTRRKRGAASPMRIASAKNTEQKILARYSEVTRVLAESEDPRDRELSAALSGRFGLNHRQTVSPDRLGERPDRMPLVPSELSHNPESSEDLER